MPKRCTKVLGFYCVLPGMALLEVHPGLALLDDAPFSLWFRFWRFLLWLCTDCRTQDGM